MLNKYCCEIKRYCDHDPSKCPIAKRNKDIDEFEKAKEKFEDLIKEDLKCFARKLEEIFRFIKKKLRDFCKKMELKMKNEVRLIDANAYQYPGDLINEPTINAKEIVTAEWETRSDGLYNVFYCSSCKGWEHRYAHEHEKMNFCPNCGAKMK